MRKHWKRHLIAALIGVAVGFIGFLVGLGVAISFRPPPPPLASPPECTTKVFEGWNAFGQADAWAKEHLVEKVVWHEPYVLAIHCER